MSNQEELHTIPSEEAEQAVILGEALKRLKQNPDFKTVIEQEYLERNVLNSVSLLAHPQVKKSGERPEVMEDLVAASNLKFFFLMIEQDHRAATSPVLSRKEEEELERKNQGE